MSYNIELIEGSIYLKIKNSARNKCSIFFIGIAGLIMFFMPVLTILLLSIDLTLGTILSCLLAWLISGYLIRLYLWNKYGEEIFIIRGKTLEVYNSYKYYRDNRKSYQFNKLEIVFFVKENTITINDKSRQTFLYDNEVSAVGFKLDKEIIKTYKEIPISAIIEISQKLNNNNILRTL